MWPDLSSPLPGIGGGEKDAALIVGIEAYTAAEHVPGAQRNVADWKIYLTQTLRVPAEKVLLLRDGEATLEKMRRYAQKTALKVEPDGTLWFVFIGHGVPSKDGKDALLVGVDAQRKADSLYERSLSRAELLSLLGQGKQGKTVVLLDACFSGKSSSGQALVKGLQPLLLAETCPASVDPRVVLLTAAKSDQFAGPLPKADRMRPAFSYLALGALRGWAADASGKVTAGALVRFAEKALRLAKDRRQTPELAAGLPGTVLGKGREPAPLLGRIDRDGAELSEGAALSPRSRAATKGGIQWVPIPGGSFMMGYEDINEAKPRHHVTVKSFEMAKTLVTFEQYRACIEAGACTPASSSCMSPAFTADDQPVVCVRWDQAKIFAEWAGGRLPSEAEWEYAARSAGKDQQYPWGDEEPTCERAVISQDGDGCGKRSTWPVCSKPKGNSEQGLCDMAGNVWQWTQDWYHDSYQGAPGDGDAWDVYTDYGHVIRGGSWVAPGNPSSSLFPASYSTDRVGPKSRHGLVACWRDIGIGFRPVRGSP